AGRQELLHGHDPLVLDPLLTVPLNDLDHVAEPVALLEKFVDLVGVLGEHQARAAVLAHVLALVGQVGRVDRHGHRPRGEDAEVREDPLVAGLTDDVDAIARLDARGDQRLANLLRVFPDLGPGHRAIGAAGLDQAGRVRAAVVGVVEEEVEDRIFGHDGSLGVPEHQRAKRRAQMIYRVPAMWARLPPGKLRPAASTGREARKCAASASSFASVIAPSLWYIGSMRLELMRPRISTLCVLSLVLLPACGDDRGSEV